MNNYDSLAGALNALRKKGYETDFATETVCLYCGDLDMRLDPDDFHVDEVYSFTDGSNTGGHGTLYAITSSSGVKGILVDSNGAYSNSLNFSMAKKLTAHHAISDQ